MSDAGQNEEQGELAGFLLAEGARDAKIGGQLMERMEEAEDRAAGGLGNGGQVEFAAEQTAESGDPGSRPGGEVGDGAVLDFAVLAERFTEEDGWGRAAIGDLRHVHNCIISEIGMHNNRYKNTYMTTSVNRITRNPLGFNYFISNARGRSVRCVAESPSRAPDIVANGAMAPVWGSNRSMLASALEPSEPPAMI